MCELLWRELGRENSTITYPLRIPVASIARNGKRASFFLLWIISKPIIESVVCIALSSTSVPAEKSIVSVW